MNKLESLLSAAENSAFFDDLMQFNYTGLLLLLFLVTSASIAVLHFVFVVFGKDSPFEHFLAGAVGPLFNKFLVFVVIVGCISILLMFLGGFDMGLFDALFRD